MKREPHAPESEKEHLQRILSLAALFRGEFNVDWLQYLSQGKASQIFSALQFGVRKKWLADKNNSVFSFINPSVQSRLQGTLSPDEQKSLHRRIADLLLAELPGESDMARIAAPHLLCLSNDLVGCRLLIAAGNLYRKSFKYDEACRHYDKAIEDLRKLEGEEADRLFIEAVLQFSRASTDDPVSDRVIAFIEEAMERADKQGNKSSLALLEMHLARNEWLRSRYRLAVKHFHKGCELAETVDDPRIKRSAAIFSQFFLYWLGRYHDVVKSYEAFVPDVEDFPKENLPLLAAVTVGACFAYSGQISQGLGMLDAIRVRCRKIGNLYIAAVADVTIGQMLLETNRLDEAKQYIEESLKEARESRNLYAHIAGLALLSQIYCLTRDVEKSVSLLKEAIALGDRAQMPMRHSSAIIAACWAMKEGKLPPVAGLSIEQEIRSALEGGNIFMKGVAFRYRALLQSFNGQPERDVIVSLRHSIHYLQVSGHPIELAKSKLEMARTYLRKGRVEKARQWAEPAAQVLSAYSESLLPDDIRPLIRDGQSGESLLDEILCLGQELVTIRDIRDLPRRIISSVNRIAGAERGAIFLLSEDDPPDVMLRAAKNLTADDIVMAGFAESMQLIKDTCNTGQGQIRDFHSEQAPHLADPSKIRSCICVPMIIRGKVVGVLYHDNRLFRSAFKERDLEILNYFAAQAAIAMDNAQAWEALRTMYEQQQREKQYYKEQYLESIRFEEFVGKSPAIQKVFKQIEQVAGTDATVLIWGETGAGKELVARSLHRRSLRSDHPFIRVNCGALPESLITSELFGHEKGAFTGAVSRRAGRFELANGGTLFLDEIGDISMEVQVRLLRVLQSKEYERVGGHETLRSDFRLIAATNRELSQDVVSGRFRQDLYYRLNVFPIFVPPLKQRPEDIPLLSQYFLEIYAGKFNKGVRSITRHDMDKLLAYDWPGNVRELENVIERGVILSNGPVYKLPDLGRSPLATPNDTRLLNLKDNERNHILHVLEKTNGKISGPGGAAEILDIHPNTLYSRMKKLGIP
ncbi:MAG: Anaerobic nitric oxide reductase transcription regulator NorR [Syntrophus sp. SKADARSKE-3]|nr:Anaerobic nitric oxide reductase transcription regulator NorR [Syntrophus sp. SKADARSKE-3]